MRRHLLFVFVLAVALIVSAATFLPIVMGDCGAGAPNQRAIEACVVAKNRELDIFAGIWIVTLANLIWQHARDSRWQFVSYFAFVILPVTGAVVLAKAQAHTWQSLYQSG